MKFGIPHGSTRIRFKLTHTLRNNVACLESHCERNNSKLCAETINGINIQMEYVETYDAAIRARRTTRDKRAIGIVVASLIGAAQHFSIIS